LAAKGVPGVLAEQDRKVLHSAVKQYQSGYLAERDAVGLIRQVLRETGLSDVLPLVPEALAKPLMDSLKNLGRFHRTYPPFADEHWRLLTYADYLVVFSLLPEQRGRPEQVTQFHGYPVLGKVEVRTPEAFGQVIESLRRGIYGDSIVKRCWDPHHGVRAVSGDRCFDLVICFQCECMHVFSDPASDEYKWADIGTAPAPVLNRLLRAAGVRVPS
jgi:hypothetical protein